MYDCVFGKDLNERPDQYMLLIKSSTFCVQHMFVSFVSQYYSLYSVNKASHFRVQFKLTHCNKLQSTEKTEANVLKPTPFRVGRRNIYKVETPLMRIKKKRKKK